MALEEASAGKRLEELGGQPAAERRGGPWTFRDGGLLGGLAGCWCKPPPPFMKLQ